MKAATPQEPIRYLVEESGRRVGVVLSLEDYQELCAAQSQDPELLVGLSDAELETLADGMLVPRLQDCLSHLLATESGRWSKRRGGTGTRPIVGAG